MRYPEKDLEFLMHFFLWYKGDYIKLGKILATRALQVIDRLGREHPFHNSSRLEHSWMTQNEKFIDNFKASLLDQLVKNPPTMQETPV